MTQGSGLRRWSAGFGLAAAGHAAAVLAAALTWEAAAPPPVFGAPPIAVELAPAAAPPQTMPRPPAPTEAIKPPEAVKPPPPKAKPRVEKPIKPTPEPKPKTVAAAEPAVPSPAPPQAAPPPVPAASAPSTGDATAAPVRETPAEVTPGLSASWQSQILGLLERNKRYPASARLHRRQGVAAVAFRIDRAGNLLSVRLVRSSGHAELDAEALDLPRRAQPLPPPPASMPGTEIELAVPVLFHLKR